MVWRSLLIVAVGAYAVFAVWHILEWAAPPPVERPSSPPAAESAAPFRLPTIPTAPLPVPTEAARVEKAPPPPAPVTIPVATPPVASPRLPAPFARPDIPRHYPHIRIAMLAYTGNPLGAFEQQLLRASVDLVVPHARYLSAIERTAPATPRFIYTNFTNIYHDGLLDWLAYADRHGHDREAAFYHVAKPTPFEGASASSLPVDWFWEVTRREAGVRGRGDLTWAAHTDRPGGVTLPGAGGALYLGHPERSCELNVKLSGAAGGGWTARLEYAARAGDDSDGPPVWKSLPLTGDGTAGWTRSGAMTFDPPADWRALRLDGPSRLYWLRVSVTAGDRPPLVDGLRGRDYVGAKGIGKGVIPAFDAEADADGDGYLNAAEYARRKPGHDARFRYESRLFYPYYGPNRFATNPSAAAVRRWFADHHRRMLAREPLASGLFLDNTTGKPPLGGATVRESSVDYPAEHAALLAEVRRAVAPKWLLASAVGTGPSIDQVLREAPAVMEEFALRPLSHHRQQFEDVAALVAARQGLTDPPAYLVLDSLPAGGSPTDGRTQLATLAYYYQLADPATTFLMFYGGFEPASPWSRHWSPAAARDIGLPTGKWTVWAKGTDPANAALTYHVYGRRYRRALVLYKPLSYARGRDPGTCGDETATRHELGGRYRPLAADGPLGPEVSVIALRNGEGAILIGP